MDITKDDIFSTAEALIKEGKKPTAILIRERLKKGSLTTISKYLRAWEQDKQIEATPSISPEFSESWSLIEHTAWRYLSPLLLKAEEKVRSEVTETITAQRKEIEELHIHTSSLEEELEGLRSEKDVEIENLKKEISQHINQIAELNVRNVADTKAVAELKEALIEKEKELHASVQEKLRLQATLEAQKKLEDILSDLKK
jgi:hypothetical protein